MSSEKVSYEIDPLNRLIINKPSKKSEIPQFRYLLDGQFKIDTDNSLIYKVKTPNPPSIPEQLKLTGNWSLDKNHSLVLTLDKENNQLAGNRITLQSRLVQAKADRLEFIISSKESGGRSHLYLVALSGIWQADKYNRLKFLAQRKTDTFKEITLSGSWEVNEKNELIYTYTQASLKRKEKSLHTLAFKGFWDITQKKRLLYVLNEELGSGFDFNVSIAEPLKRGMRYEIGIGAKPAKKKITLFGSWKINNKLGLVFEMPAENGKVNSVAVGATFRLNKNKQLEVTLKDSLQKDLGIKLKLSQNLLKDQGEAFIQALKNGEEISLSAGLGFRW